jgi:hypothetical protein
MPVLTQISHYLQQAFTTLRGLSIVSIVLIILAVIVALRLFSGILRVVVPLALLLGGGYLLLHVLHVF